MTQPIITHSPDETFTLGKKFATNLQPGAVLALTGDLGSGKTTFIQGLAQGLGITKRILSPTFILARQYPLPGSSGLLVHLDLYRLHTEADLESLGFLDLVTDPANITALEWPQLAQPLLPSRTLHLVFKPLSESSRQITLPRP